MSRARTALKAAAAVIGLTVVLDGAILAFADDAGPAAAQTRAVAVDLRAPTRQPAFPAAAQAATPEGATAFVRWWFDALNWSLVHGDSTLLASHVNAGCQLCNGYLVGIVTWATERSQLQGGLTAPLSLAIGPFSTTEPVTFAADFLTTPARLTKADGSATDYPGGRTRGGISVLRGVGGWQVVDVVLDLTKVQETQ